jgi:hypothetical protein
MKVKTSGSSGPDDVHATLERYLAGNDAQDWGGVAKCFNSDACRPPGGWDHGSPLPPSWDHLFSQSWDRPACCDGESFVSLFDHRVSVLDEETSRVGYQRGRRG